MDTLSALIALRTPLFCVRRAPTGSLQATLLIWPLQRFDPRSSADVTGSGVSADGKETIVPRHDLAEGAIG